MGNAILKSLLLPVLLVQAGLLGAAEYRVCFRNNGPKAWSLRVAGGALDAANTADTFQLNGRGSNMPLGGQGTPSPWKIQGQGDQCDLIVRCEGSLSARVELEDANGNARVLTLSGTSDKTLVQVLSNSYRASQGKPMKALSAGQADKVIDLTGEIKQSDYAKATDPSFRLVSINEASYPLQ